MTELFGDKHGQGDAQPALTPEQSTGAEILALVTSSRRAVTMLLLAGMLLGLFWALRTNSWQTSVRITLHSTVAGYSERSFWESATKAWLVRLNEAALKEQSLSGLQIFVFGTDPLGLWVSCSHRERGAAVPVLQRVLENVMQPGTEEPFLEMSAQSLGAAVKHSGNLRAVLQGIDAELSRICRNLKVPRQRPAMDREISSIAETSDGSNVPIETVTWYPWYAALQREYIYVWSMSAERQQDEVLRVNVESELTAVANQLDRASVLLVIAWKSLSTRNASNWDVDVRHGQIREEQVSWRKTLLDPLLSGVLLGLLSAGTWIASKRWLLTLSVVNGAGVVGADE